MKTSYLLLAVIAVLAISFLLRGWLAQPKRSFRTLRNLATLFVFGLQWALTMPSALRARIRFGGSLAFANEIQVGTHEKVITKFTSVAITTRHLLFAQDLTDARKITPILTALRPLYSVPDEVAAVDLAGQSPSPVSAIMLGVTNDTVRMVANAAGIGPGAPVFAVAGGMVDIQANLTTGTWYLVGFVVARTSTAQGDLLEVAACPPTASVTV